jgi:TolB-like protein
MRLRAHPVTDGDNLARQQRRSLQESWRTFVDGVSFCRGLSYPPCMIYRFGHYELNAATHELRADGTVLDLEPQVFALLVLLVENRQRLVSKEEIVERVWDGRAISDAAIASRVKSARHALGDDGKTQRYIKTVHRLGFRFTAPVNLSRAPSPVTVTAVDTGERGTREHERVRVAEHLAASRPSIAVLPFQVMGFEGLCEALAVAVPDELISELSRMRWLFVTARGSSFRVRQTESGMAELGRLLRVRYCLTGAVEISNRTVTITVELVDTLDEGVVWAERFSGRIDDVHAMREDIRSQVLVALEIRIPIHEATLARVKSSENIDAWTAYHLGLQHMYRFNRPDNAAAAKLFERAIALDPAFARAHAGLSFIHFQSAFMRYTDDFAHQLDQARRFAERGLELDPLDPFVNFTMGRTHWLSGDLEGSFTWLERATGISPHYAHGIYARAWSEALLGRTADSRSHVELAMRLSPLDPLHYAMLGTRALGHLAANENAEAAIWSERAARAAGAHVLIAMIATAAHALSGDTARAEMWASNVRTRNDALTREDFLRAFPMKPEPMRTRVLAALSQFGF